MYLAEFSADAEQDSEENESGTIHLERYSGFAA